MPNDTAEYLRRYSKAVADLREYTIVADNRNGSYIGETIDTKAQRELDSRPGVTWKSGQRVVAEDVSASQNVIGANPIIVGPSPKDQRGTSETTPSETATSFTRPFVASIDPDPVILEAGGSAASQIISGNAITEAGEYVAGGGVGDDPVVVDDSAPIITTSKVTRSIRADEDSPLGTFDLEIDGVRIRKALEIVAAAVVAEFDVLDTIYVISGGDLVALNPADLTVIHTSAIGSSPSIYGIAQLGDAMLLAGYDSSVGTLFVFDPKHRAFEAIPVEWPDGEAAYFMVAVDNLVWFGARGAGTVKTNAASMSAEGVITTYEMDASSIGNDVQIVANEDVLWIGDTHAKLFRFDTGALTSSSVVMPAAPHSGLAMHAGSLYVIAPSTGARVYRRDPDTGAAIADAALAASEVFASLVSAGGKLFAVSTDLANHIKVYMIADDLSTVDEVASIDHFGGGLGFVATDGAAVFITGASTFVFRVDGATYNVTSVTLAGETAAVAFFTA